MDISAARPITVEIQRRAYRPHPANPATVAKTVVDLLERHPLVVLTGTNQPFVQNRNIGKTLACKSIRERMIVRGKGIYYIDIKTALKVGTGDFSYPHLDDLDHIITKLSDWPYIIFDEVHYAFPRDARSTARDVWGQPVYRGEKYNQTMFAFWRKVTELQARGSRFLMITALHPLDIVCQQFLVNADIEPYFSAPTVELALTARPA